MGRAHTRMRRLAAGRLCGGAFRGRQAEPVDRRGSTARSGQSSGLADAKGQVRRSLEASGPAAQATAHARDLQAGGGRMGPRTAHGPSGSHPCLQGPPAHLRLPEDVGVVLRGAARRHVPRVILVHLRGGGNDQPARVPAAARYSGAQCGRAGRPHAACSSECGLWACSRPGQLGVHARPCCPSRPCCPCCPYCPRPGSRQPAGCPRRWRGPAL